MPAGRKPICLACLRTLDDAEVPRGVCADRAACLERFTALMTNDATAPAAAGVIIRRLKDRGPGTRLTGAQTIAVARVLAMLRALRRQGEFDAGRT